MRLLISGCSFTYDSWPNLLLDNNTSVKNLAFPGVGNKFIADSVMHELTKNSYDHVLVMWSGLTRLDFPVDDLDYFSQYSFKKNIGKQLYIMSGGRMGSWQQSSIIKLLFTGFYKFNSFENLAFLSLLEIIKLQNYLENNNIKYSFMSYVNYWNRPSDWMSENLDEGLNNYAGLSDIIQQIDFTNWLFLNDNKDGLYEIAETYNDFLEDNFHPGPISYQKWADIVKEKLISN